jgi:hypothetical protein
LVSHETYWEEFVDLFHPAFYDYLLGTDILVSPIINNSTTNTTSTKVRQWCLPYRLIISLIDLTRPWHNALIGVLPRGCLVGVLVRYQQNIPRPERVDPDGYSFERVYRLSSCWGDDSIELDSMFELIVSLPCVLKRCVDGPNAVAVSIVAPQPGSHQSQVMW